MRTDQPLPGDLVIRSRRASRSAVRREDVYVVTRWPNAEAIVAGPYQSFSYALTRARRMAGDPSLRIWRDHAKPGQPEELAQVEET